MRTSPIHCFSRRLLKAIPGPSLAPVRCQSTAHAPSKSTTTTLKISQLPKLAKPPTTYQPLVNEPLLKLESYGDKKIQLPPLLRSIREVMDRHKGYVVLTQVGAFYELYFEQASEYAEKLNITLTQKSMTDCAIPMSGFPLSQLERHLKVLVQDLHECVAIVEQYEGDDDPEGKNKVIPRRVTRLVTAGTLVDEAFLNQQENNFLLCIKFPEKLFMREPDLDAKLGLSWMDLSVGSLFVQEVRLEDLMSTVTRIKPSEIIVGDDDFADVVNSGKWYSELAGFQKYFLNHFKAPTRHKTLEEFYYMFNFTRHDLKKSFEELSIWESSAIRIILRYVEEHLPGTTISLQLPVKQHPEDLMFIDSRTSESLELHVSMRSKKSVGSLFSSIKRTVTPGGSRLLGTWLSAPSRNLDELKIRQRMVNEFVKNTTFKNNVVSKLKRIHDVSRILQRFALGKGSHFDLIRLAHSIKRTDELENIITEQSSINDDSMRSLGPLLKRFKPQGDLANEILNDLDEDAIVEGLKLEEQEKEAQIYPTFLEKRVRPTPMNALNLPNFIVKKSASPNLARLHNRLSKLYDEKALLEGQLHQYLVIMNGFKEVLLKVTMSGEHQVFIRGGPKNNFDLLPKLMPSLRSVNGGKSKSTRWMEFDDWTNLGEGIQSTVSLIQKEEQVVLKQLKKKVNESSLDLRQSSQNTEYIDVIASFAALAVEKDLVCPTLDLTTAFDVVQGRHLVAEEGLKRELRNFVPNDCRLDEDRKRWIITGPNMGGKSTFLRQNAIIVILAQIGCFVPAHSATIGLVDKIFSRVGFNDDMMNQLSTFMVEMLEVSYILHGATNRSLAILDEVGRGTSGREGVAIAFSTLYHLNKVNGSRVLFATHFGKEVALLLERDGLDSQFAFKKTALVNDGDNIKMTHQLVDGITDRSHAISVARAAGYPPLAIDKAKHAYEFLSEKDIL